MGLTSTMHKRLNRRSLQSGAVSLFLVVFATLLITVVTVSFLRTMIQDQLQATNLDLSQSAYDSAQAGVQDAQRALLRYLTACNADATECDALKSQLSQWGECNGGLANIVDTSGPEVKVQQSAGGDNLNQAYTCVTIDMATDDVIGSIGANDTKLIPLIGTENFDTIQIDWFTQEDVGSTSKVIDVTAPRTPSPLMKNSTTTLWKANRPSLLEAQLIQYGENGFTLSDFNANSSSESNANTLFLYPACFGTGSPSPNNCDIRPSTQPFVLDARIDKEGMPVNVNCASMLSGGGYACSQILTLPTPVGGGLRTAYLNLKPLYNGTHFRVKLLQGSTTPINPVSFSGVQASIDSTGRANNIFRRVETRVDLEAGAFPFPKSALDITGNFCKNFFVTQNVDHYDTVGTACTP